MWQKTPDQKYQAYLTWFDEQVSDPSNWPMLRADRDCANWHTSIQDDEGNLKSINPGKPIPWDRGMALYKMGDPKAMQAVLSKKIESNHQKYTQMSKYINGDPKQGTYNDEYANNYKALKATQEELKRSYSVYTNLTPEQIKKVNDKHQDAIQPKEQWRDLSMWEAAKHFLKGGDVTTGSNPAEFESMRDYVNRRK